MCILLLQTATSCWEMLGCRASSPSCTAPTASVIYPATPGRLLSIHHHLRIGDRREVNETNIIMDVYWGRPLCTNVEHNITLSRAALRVQIQLYFWDLCYREVGIKMIKKRKIFFELFLCSVTLPPPRIFWLLAPSVHTHNIFLSPPSPHIKQFHCYCLEQKGLNCA